MGGAFAADDGNPVAWAKQAHTNADRKSLSCHAAAERARLRHERARRCRLRAIGLQWQTRRRLFDRFGTVVAEAEEDGLLKLDVSPPGTGEPVVVWATGEIDITSSPRLEACLMPILMGGNDLLLDFAGVSFMDASGVGVLSRAHRLAQETGAAFSVQRPARFVVRVLEITGYIALIAD
jgi:anti-anti-sigma factor